MLLIQGPPSTINTLAISPDGKEVAIGTKDGSVALVDIFGGEHRVLGSYSTSVNSVVFNESLGVIYFGTGLGMFTFVCNGLGAGKMIPPLRERPIAALSVLNEMTLVIGTGDRAKTISGRLELYSLASGRMSEPTFLEPQGVRSVAANPMTRTIAWTNASNRASIWNTHTIQPRHIGLTHSSPSLAFQPDGERLAVAMEWGVKVFDVAMREEQFALKGHTGRVTAVAYSPDGKMIVTSSWDQTVRVWDADGGASRGVFDWGIGKVFCLAFSPDGLLMAAGGENGNIAIWDIE